MRWLDPSYGVEYVGNSIAEKEEYFENNSLFGVAKEYRVSASDRGLEVKKQTTGIIELDFAY